MDGDEGGCILSTLSLHLCVNEVDLMPPTLRVLLQFAAFNNCKYLHIDYDGQVLSEFPEFKGFKNGF